MRNPGLAVVATTAFHYQYMCGRRVIGVSIHSRWQRRLGEYEKNWWPKTMIASLLTLVSPLNCLWFMKGVSFWGWVSRENPGLSRTQVKKAHGLGRSQARYQHAYGVSLPALVPCRDEFWCREINGKLNWGKWLALRQRQLLTIVILASSYVQKWLGGWLLSSCPET